MRTGRKRRRGYYFAWTGALWLAAGAMSGKGQEDPSSNDERATAAQVEMFLMKTYFENILSDTGYLVSLETLNDTLSSSAKPAYDYVSNGGGTRVINPSTGRFMTSRVNLASSKKWQGPYMTYNATRTQSSTQPYDQGTPLDPWGRPYYLFTPLGLVRGDPGIVTPELYADAFDKYTIVCVGADGMLNQNGKGDDIIVTFGPSVTTLGISSISGANVRRVGVDYVVPEGGLLAIRGIAMGDSRSDGRVLFGGNELKNVRSWGSREVRVQLPMGLGGRNTVTVTRGGVTSNPITLTITVAARSAAEDWEFYR